VTAVDCKTFALHGGGISHFFAPLLQAWIKSQVGATLKLVGPHFEQNDFGLSDDPIALHKLSWPSYLPRPLRHPYYDNILFPSAVRTLRPSAIFSPYHDVRIPKGIPSVITIHDLCIEELTKAYPLKIRAYYQAMLKVNLSRASFLLTVSETTRKAIVERYKWPEDRIEVVYNTLNPKFSSGDVDELVVADWRNKYPDGTPLLLYTSGIEYRKNIPRLLEALDHLHYSCDIPPMLLVTGRQSQQWQCVLANASERVKQRVHFLGYLSLADLRLAYASVDAVVFPSLGEGFGRACLESMATGTPLACSDLPVLKEISGNYPVYFNPYQADSIAEGVRSALCLKRRTPVIDPRFEISSVQSSFVKLMYDVLG
jgi:glycosyltransferase involved in cell wall biosynthesis